MERMNTKEIEDEGGGGVKKRRCPTFMEYKRKNSNVQP